MLQFESSIYIHIYRSDNCNKPVVSLLQFQILVLPSCKLVSRLSTRIKIYHKDMSRLLTMLPLYGWSQGCQQESHKKVLEN